MSNVFPSKFSQCSHSLMRGKGRGIVVGEKDSLINFHGAFLLNLYLVFSNLRRLGTNLTKKRRGKLHKNVDGERVFYSCLLRVLEWLVGIDISYYDNITLLYTRCNQTYVHGLIRTRICIYVWEKKQFTYLQNWIRLVNELNVS